MDSMRYGKASVLGAVNGMIAGLVAITPAAGYVDGTGAIIIGVCAGIIPWASMNLLQKTSFMMKVDDTLSVFSTHGVAGLMGGLLTGVLANPAMVEYIGTGKDAPGVSGSGLLYGNRPPAFRSGRSRSLHHRPQCHRHLYHPVRDQDLRSAQDG